MLKTLLSRISIVSAVLAFIALGGCYPQGASYVDELDLTVSIQNTEVNYADYQSFYIEDTVVLISNNAKSKYLDQPTANFLVNEFRMRMLELGWTEITNPDTSNIPDVAVLMTVLENVTVNVVSGGWGWSGWGGWGYWGYPGGGYYPGYPGYPGYCCYTSIYSYTTGSLIIEMLDPSLIEDEGAFDPVPVIWGGGINGYQEGSKSNIQARVKRSMDQMIIDSPYLDKN